ncbi:hypothetical protein DACRYDRAFT_107922 [Dacryopinax primogenitus]|uniref:Uncharacterized protein n=1 Tax=Dacryopinax primogenitus (strain DJM 731) TaxID=1858805 RepID=M5GBI7_DACPD|nr:uncharacterized protein DACRYDRAFT_107922 [Dacryopinax primogenitus]EJU01368.1 hypothetical protein DACRYDRAFT_107922 [Dacryopinax primogenitus]
MGGEMMGSQRVRVRLAGNCLGLEDQRSRREQIVLLTAQRAAACSSSTSKSDYYNGHGHGHAPVEHGHHHLPPGQFPYPKHVWSPAGGWWTRPKNWVTNTAVVIGGCAVISYFAFRYSAEHEHRLAAPHRPVPSQLWAKEFKDGKVKVIEY